MKAISMFVEGTPIAQPRQRHRNAGRFIQSYTPATHPVTAWKHAIKTTYLSDKGRVTLNEGKPLVANIQFIMPRPKDHYRANGTIKGNRPYWHTSKPDLDNLAKSVLDALVDVEAIQDDSQVAKLTLEKYYITPPHMRPGVYIEIKELP